MVYIDGFVAPVKAGTVENYVAFAERAAVVFKEHGAIRVVESWADDVPQGEVTDFYRSVLSGDGETIVFSWVEWPDKATRDAGMQKVMEDSRMNVENAELPFDGKRMIFGGFQAVVDA